MTHVDVNLGERSYTITIGQGVLTAGEGERHVAHKTLIVTDAHVDPLFGAACEQAWRRAGSDPVRVVLPPGETSKSLDTLAMLYAQALEHGLDRRSHVVALGGGVIGDVAGFMAATYMRGIGFWQIPTTLLAMVDSSVGGKTGINLPSGKNLVGAFHQPLGVVADLGTLHTLSERDYASGLAEAVKTALIGDADLWAEFNERVGDIKARSLDVMETIVAACCRVKADVVAQDERESGRREILNFGHTLGHALELAGGYARWRHGEAVAMGMVYAARLSTAITGFPRGDVARLEQCLANLGLPVTLGSDADVPDWQMLRAALSRDKKSHGAKPRFVLLERLGQARAGCEVHEDDMRRVYENWTSR